MKPSLATLLGTPPPHLRLDSLFLTCILLLAFNNDYSHLHSVVLKTHAGMPFAWIRTRTVSLFSKVHYTPVRTAGMENSDSIHCSRMWRNRATHAWLMGTEISVRLGDSSALPLKLNVHCAMAQAALLGICPEE